MTQEAILAETPPEPKPDTDASDDPWREKFKRQVIQLRGLGWDAVMLDKIRRQERIVRQNAQRVANGTVGKQVEDEDVVAEDDMGLSIGDTVNHNYPAPTAPAASGTSIWPMILALLVSLATLGLVLWMLLKPADKDPSLNPGGLTIEVVKVPPADPATPPTTKGP